ncbi:type II secretion system protein GspM [Wenzhouxiangella marina]|uniref:Type II secretion system protein M n=1 Tax=Wenzhouxiangella marina TaxID=1579979 RepID=A0A0K0XTG0_9GAMM|nr:type II secretion system protein GspM [Wenzhouxiangella marina]AKS40945.1 hypothetical protein WM2015_563 [Wenzhouxiangella marina]MBB6087819.1 general secretion pathway protein M [Wenzhouxiangella marina]
MSEWWNRLAIRQRVLMILAALVALGALLFVEVWEPLVEAREMERERIAQQQALLDWLVAVTPVAQQLRGQSQATRLDPDQSLLGLADRTARAAGLAGALTRIEPAGDGQVRVWLDGADFVAMMSWLQQLSRQYPIEVQQLSADRARADGQVNVRVTLSTNA